MMLLVVALLVWFAVSIPATVIIGRVLGAASSGTRVAFPEPGRVPMHRHGLVRS